MRKQQTKDPCRGATNGPPRLMATSNPSTSSSPWIRRIRGAAECRWRVSCLVTGVSGFSCYRSELISVDFGQCALLVNPVAADGRYPQPQATVWVPQGGSPIDPSPSVGS